MRNSGESLHKFEQRIKERYRYVLDIWDGKFDPLRNIKERTFKSKYFPHLNSEEKRGMRIYLKRRTY